MSFEYNGVKKISSIPKKIDMLINSRKAIITLGSICYIDYITKNLYKYITTSLNYSPFNVFILVTTT